MDSVNQVFIIIFPIFPLTCFFILCFNNIGLICFTHPLPCSWTCPLPKPEFIQLVPNAMTPTIFYQYQSINQSIPLIYFNTSVESLRSIHDDVWRVANPWILLVIILSDDLVKGPKLNCIIWVRSQQYTPLLFLTLEINASLHQNLSILVWESVNFKCVKFHVTFIIMQTTTPFQILRKSICLLLKSFFCQVWKGHLVTL